LCLARDRPRVLLADRADGRPPRRDARVRHPTDAARTTAARDRLHAKPPAPTTRRVRDPDWPTGARGPGRPVAVVGQPALRDAARRTPGGRVGAAARAPQPPPRARADRSDR